MSWEARVLLAVQRGTGARTVLVARALSRAGDHAAAWIAVGVAGAVADHRRRAQWVEALTAVVAAHAASVIVKRVARRVRPTHDGLVSHVEVPSRWSFPSSHATSTTTAAMVYGPLLGSRLSVVLPPAMAWSRLALGVHYPSDVLWGTALGAAVATVANRAHQPPHAHQRPAH